MKYIFLLNIVALMSCQRMADDPDESERIVKALVKAEKRLAKELAPQVYTVQKGNP